MRHVYIVVAELGLQDAKGVKTPCEMKSTWTMNVFQTLSKVDSTRFRVLSSRSSVLASDRMDIPYSVNELSI